MPSAAASVEAPTATVIGVAAVRLASFSVAVTVTVVAPASSATVVGDTESVMPVEAVSSLVIVPVPVSVAVTGAVVPDTDRPTVKVSSLSTTASSFVATVNVCVSDAAPANVSAAVFSA